MVQEIIATGKTVESAILNGARELGVDRNLVNYEIIEMPKKGFLGFGEIPAKVKVFYEAGSECSALDFVNQLIKDMELDATATVSDLSSDTKIIKIDGGECGMLIGHHGETLDALQYLVNLVANKREEDSDDGEAESSEAATDGKKKSKYTRFTVDIENYRAKREETLRTLARKKAMTVTKYKKPITLEPMPPYERRIIHSEIQGIKGVYTKSIGSDSSRRIVIYPENKPDFKGNNSRGRRGNDSRNADAKTTAPVKEEASQENSAE